MSTTNDKTPPAEDVLSNLAGGDASSECDDSEPDNSEPDEAIADLFDAGPVAYVAMGELPAPWEDFTHGSSEYPNLSIHGAQAVDSIGDVLPDGCDEHPAETVIQVDENGYVDIWIPDGMVTKKNARKAISSHIGKDVRIEEEGFAYSM